MKISFLFVQFQNPLVFLLRKQSLLLILLILSKSSFSQLTIDETATAQQLVNSIVQPGYAVSNIKLMCPEGAIAAFTGTSDIAFNNGILLTTGKAAYAKGPNTKPDASFSSGGPGDLQLNSLSGAETFDACVLEFDVVAISDTLRIRYVFGSEEYPEFLNTQFHDALGIFVSGPGITSSKNIAMDVLSNNQYFIDNTNGTSIQYDGYTKPFTATQPVIANSTYHLKIAIADVTDGLYDSGVFIENGSIATDIKPNRLDAFVQLYPNPANELIYIQAPLFEYKNISVSLYSVIGKLIYQETYTNTNQAHLINISSIEANGIYFIKLQSGDESITRKIMINH
jgi:hypothetical protein